MCYQRFARALVLTQRSAMRRSRIRCTAWFAPEAVHTRLKLASLLRPLLFRRRCGSQVDVTYSLFCSGVPMKRSALQLTAILEHNTRRSCFLLCDDFYASVFELLQSQP